MAAAETGVDPEKSKIKNQVASFGERFFNAKRAPQQNANVTEVIAFVYETNA